MPLFLLAQASSTAETVTNAVNSWGDFADRYGVPLAILALIFALGGVHYWFVILPREKGKTEDQRQESKARTNVLNKVGEASEKTADATEKIADCVQRHDRRFDKIDEHFVHVHSRLDNIWRNPPPPPASL